MAYGWSVQQHGFEVCDFCGSSPGVELHLLSLQEPPPSREGVVRIYKYCNDAPCMRYVAEQIKMRYKIAIDEKGNPVSDV